MGSEKILAAHGRCGPVRATCLLNTWSCTVLHPRRPQCANRSQGSCRGCSAASRAVDARIADTMSRQECAGARPAMPAGFALRGSLLPWCETQLSLWQPLIHPLLRKDAPHAPAAADAQASEEQATGVAKGGPLTAAPTGWHPLTQPLLWQACSQSTFDSASYTCPCAIERLHSLLRKPHGVPKQPGWRCNFLTCGPDSS